jgi:hypothetical protein
MDYTSLAIGAAVGWVTSVGYAEGFETILPYTMAVAKTKPIGFVYPVAGAYVGMMFLPQFYPLPNWAWAAIGANLSTMFLPKILNL